MADWTKEGKFGEVEPWVKIRDSYVAKRNGDGGGEIVKQTTQSSNEANLKETVHNLGNFWMMAAYIKKHGVPKPELVSWELDGNGELTEGVLRDRELDGPIDSLPSSVWQINKRVTSGIERKRLEDDSLQHVRDGQGAI